MKLYIFKITTWSKPPRLMMDEIEVGEKPKSYVCNGRRFSKDDIGRAIGYERNECMLIENNPSKACEILLKTKEKELEWAMEKIADKKAEIEMLKNHIKE